MAGLISNQTARAQNITPESVAAKMKVPPQLQPAFSALLVAGRKILYSAGLQPQIKELLNNELPMSEKLGQGIALVVMQLWSKGNSTLPPQLIIPVGVSLVAQAAALFRKAGVQVSDQDIAGGIQAYIRVVMNKVKQQESGAHPAQQQQAPAAPTAGGAPVQQLNPPPGSRIQAGGM